MEVYRHNVKCAYKSRSHCGGVFKHRTTYKYCCQASLSHSLDVGVIVFMLFRFFNATESFHDLLIACSDSFRFFLGMLTGWQNGTKNCFFFAFRVLVSGWTLCKSNVTVENSEVADWKWRYLSGWSIEKIWKWRYLSSLDAALEKCCYRGKRFCYLRKRLSTLCRKWIDYLGKKWKKIPLFRKIVYFKFPTS